MPASRDAASRPYRAMPDAPRKRIAPSFCGKELRCGPASRRHRAMRDADSGLGRDTGAIPRDVDAIPGCDAEVAMHRMRSAIRDAVTLSSALADSVLQPPTKLNFPPARPQGGGSGGRQPPRVMRGVWGVGGGLPPRIRLPCLFPEGPKHYLRLFSRASGCRPKVDAIRGGPNGDQQTATGFGGSAGLCHCAVPHTAKRAQRAHESC